MIQETTRLKVADNTGARTIMCIRVMGGSNRKYAAVGDIIIASVKSADAQRHCKKRRSRPRRGCSHRQRIRTQRRLVHSF